MAAIPLSSVIGGPISGLILDHFNGAMKLSGWQWLFILEGIPSIVVGFLVLLVLVDKPADAKWLEPAERDALNDRLAAEARNREAVRHYSLKDALTNPRVLALSVIYFGLVSGNYGLGYWLPTIVKGVASTMGLDAASGIQINTLVGYLVAVPYALAVMAMIWWTRRSDVTGERT
jgi:MFS family permease